MKVCILTEGGRNIGFGHITRCVSIYQAFEERGILPLLIINGDETVKDLLQNKNYRIFDWLSDHSLLFELLKDDNARQCKSEVGRRVVDGVGSLRIVKESSV